MKADVGVTSITIPHGLPSAAYPKRSLKKFTMDSLDSILSLVVINGALLLVATSHLRRTSTWKARAVSSIGIFLLAQLAVTIFSYHKCNEGSTPPFVMYAVASVAALFPWIYSTNPWAIRGMIAVTVMTGMLSAKHLTSSYHSERVTGNPSYATERYWHTPFTGQYPRDREKMATYRQKRFGTNIFNIPEGSEQDAAGQSATAE